MGNHRYTSTGTVRSNWEIQAEDYIRGKYPGLKIITNDRTIVPSRKTQKKLELDIFIPEIRLAFELNGENYHSKAAYDYDRLYGTEQSDEMYKENFCRSKGIKLVHIWSSSSANTFETIDSEIRTRIDDPTIKPYKKDLSDRQAEFLVECLFLWGPLLFAAILNIIWVRDGGSAKSAFCSLAFGTVFCVVLAYFFRKAK